MHSYTVSGIFYSFQQILSVKISFVAFIWALKFFGGGLKNLGLIGVHCTMFTQIDPR